MSHLISIELDDEIARRIQHQLYNRAMPPLDQEDLDQDALYRAIEEALENDDG